MLPFLAIGEANRAWRACARMPQPPPAPAVGTVLGRVDIHRSQNMAPTRNSMDADCVPCRCACRMAGVETGPRSMGLRPLPQHLQCRRETIGVETLIG